MSGLVNSTVDVTSSFETIQTGLTTVMQSAEKGKEAFEDLRKFSNETTFGVDELANASTQLMNVGMQFDEVKEKLRLLGDISGGSKEKFAELVSIFAKIQSTGKATQREIQMLAMRGIPIIQMLKDMGVEGVATAEDISQAFETMAGAGGQFNGAMENILSTIEGKKGEIADFAKEATVSFGEASGVVDMYKVGLDAVREVTIKIADVMNFISQNPVLKALFSGVFVGSIIAIGTTILTVIIPALKAVIVKLGVIDAMQKANPIGLIIGGITASVVGLVSIMNHFSKEAEELHNQLVQQEKEQLMISEELRDLQLDKTGGTGYSNEINAKVDELAETLAKLKEKQAQLTKETERYNRSINGSGNLTETYRNNMNQIQKQMEGLKEQEKIIKDKIRWLREEEILQQKILAVEKQRAQAQANAKEKYQNIVEQIRSEYGKLNKTTAEQKLAQLIAMRDAKYEEKFYMKIGGANVEQTRVVTLDQQSTEMLNALIEEQKKIVAKEKLDGVETWAEKFKNSTGEEVTGTLKGNKWVSQYTTSLKKNADFLDKMRKQWGEAYTLQDDLNAQEKKLADLKKSYIELVANGFDTTEEVVKVLNELNEEILKQKGMVSQKQSEFNDYKGREYIGQTGENFGTSISRDASAIVQGAEQGGFWGAIINVFLNAIQKVIQGIEGADEVLNPISTAMETFKPVLVEIFKLLTKFQPFINGVMNELSKAFQQLLPLLDAISTILEVINGIISGILLLLRYFQPILKIFAEAIKAIVNFLFGWLLDGLNDLTAQIEVTTQAEEENANALEKINEQYRNLTQSLREYEEYYLQKRRELNAENELNKLTAVNDMILTPNGTFSTHPDDYLIATKNPFALNNSNGGTTVNVVVKNEVGNYATATATQTTDANGNAQLLINISRKIAQDVANGDNGWDGALQARNYRIAGKRLSM